MGLEVLSNIGATYKEVPREIIKLDTSNTSNLQYDRGVQTIAQTETKAVQNTENNKANAEGDEKSKMNQRIKSAVDKANERAKKTHCEFQYHEDTNRISISVKDDETGEVIKQIPAEETLDMLSKMWEMAGLFVDDKRYTLE